MLKLVSKLCILVVDIVACNIGEVLLGDLARNGFTVTEDTLEADCIVVNTCAFVEDAKAESLEVCNEAH